MKVLVSTMPYAGHFNPTEAIVKELVHRGHQVVWNTGSAYEQRVLRVGARFRQMSKDATIDDDQVKPDPGFSGLAKVLSFLRKLFLDRVPAQVQDYQDALKTFPADILLVEFATLGAQALRDLTGLPYATLGTNPLVTLDPEVPPWGTGKQPPTTVFGRWINMATHKGAGWFFYSQDGSRLERATG